MILKANVDLPAYRSGDSTSIAGRKIHGRVKATHSKIFPNSQILLFFLFFLTFPSLVSTVRPDRVRTLVANLLANVVSLRCQKEGSIFIEGESIFTNIQYSSIFIEGEQLKSVSINCKIKIFLFQWRQVWFTKDSDCKRQTAENYPKTAKTEFPEKQSESAGDRGRVHGVTSKI